jgi:putative tryptophan/tyrosine transport system substrate-binding protein
MRRRQFVGLVGTAVVVWPLISRAQQPTAPVIGYLGFGSLENSASYLAAFRKGLNEEGFIEDRNVTIDYRWLEGQYDRLPEFATDLVRRRVAVIATPGNPPSTVRSVMAATAAIPIVFGVGDDPVKWGLVANLARPKSNATGVNFLSSEVVTKRLNLLHGLVPGATRIAILLNPADPARGKSMLEDVEGAADTLGLQTRVLNASTSQEIDEAFATLTREPADALFVSPDAFFNTRRVQIAMLTARYGIPAAFAVRQYVDAGGMMSYGVDLGDMFRQVGVYTGKILKGAKPADLPVAQLTKLELVINAQTARMLGLTIPPALLATADEVIE